MAFMNPPWSFFFAAEQGGAGGPESTPRVDAEPQETRRVVPDARDRGESHTFERAEQPAAYETFETTGGDTDGQLALSGSVQPDRSIGLQAAASATGFGGGPFGHGFLFAEAADSPLPLRAPTLQTSSDALMDSVAAPIATGEDASGNFVNLVGGTSMAVRGHGHLAAAATALGLATVEANGIVLPANWAAERDQIRNRLSAIEAALHELKPVVEAVERLGPVVASHNRPDIPLLTASLIDEGLAANRALRVQLSIEKPSFEAIRLCGIVITRVALAIIHYGDKFLEAFAKSAGSALGKATIGTGLTKVAVDALGIDLHEIGRIVHHWVQSLPL